jgi:DNA-binding GntR family transcriptional regulator
VVDYLKLALILLWDRHRKCPDDVSTFASHDEIIVEYAEKDVEKAEALLNKAMIDRMEEVVNELKADGPPVAGPWIGEATPETGRQDNFA